ncbi:AI-2E family transporter [Achromobacter deleyi]|uniref:AI-2E family transporter n=1 Tax=Achromobacter deleyi TaxID=1353891 RepID=UPI001490B9BC|nr:AI-2E family transporter [Achromobacter deleyi]QVQ27076.1 AI-2E family transporter [Achromobacter deleyi]UIP22661.1 AI-2E family transporter [Achromobacter deleyi]
MTSFALSGICAILILGLLYLASPVFVPLAFALFLICLVAPLRQSLGRRMPAPLAAIAVLLVTLAVSLVFLSLAGWGFSLVAQWVMANAGRFQRLFTLETETLHPHGAMVIRMFQDSFNVSWLVRAIQEIALRINSMLGLIFLSFVFIALGLFELDEAPGRLIRLLGEERARRWMEIARQVASKLRRYMVIRTVASVLTGVTVWLFAIYAGLELATAWGGLAFLLNYIPFLGPLVATVFPAFFAFVQYGSLQTSLAVLVVLNCIQIVYGCYLEPRLAGSAFSLSPLMVMVAVFFWGLVWGIPGTFIGVPLLITMTTVYSATTNFNRGASNS